MIALFVLIVLYVPLKDNAGQIVLRWEKYWYKKCVSKCYERFEWL